MRNLTLLDFREKIVKDKKCNDERCKCDNEEAFCKIETEYDLYYVCESRFYEIQFVNKTIELTDDTHYYFVNCEDGSVKAFDNKKEAKKYARERKSREFYEKDISFDDSDLEIEAILNLK